MSGAPSPGAQCRSCISASCTLGCRPYSHFMEGETDVLTSATQGRARAVARDGWEGAVRMRRAMGTRGFQALLWSRRSGRGDHVLESGARRGQGTQGTTRCQKQKQTHFPSILSKVTTALVEQSQRELLDEECLLQRTSSSLFLRAQLAACFPLSRTSLQFLLDLVSPGCMDMR